MDKYLFFAVLICLIFTSTFLSPVNALRIDHRNKRSPFLPSVSEQEAIEDPAIEVENQISSSNIRNLRENTPPVLRDLGDDDAQYVDDSPKEGDRALKAQLRAEYNNWKVRNEEMFKAMNEEGEIPMRRMTFTSKYMGDQSNKTVKTYKILKDACEKYKLEMVQITNEADFGTLTSLLVGDNNLVIGLGLNDIKEEGKFVEADGVTPAAFQMFAKGEPDDLQGKNNCVTLTMSPEPEKEIAMRDTNCDDINAHVICQRRQGSFSFNDSVENIGKEPEGLDMIGDSNDRRFYIGRIQKTWGQAKQACANEKKILLELSANEDANQGLYRSIMTWRSTKGLYTPTGFWTSGRFKDSIKSNAFIWESTGLPFDVKKKDIMWEWVKNEPADQTGKGVEKCIDISFPPKANRTLIPELRISNCGYPFYYVCYEQLHDYRDSLCQERPPFATTAPYSKYLYDAIDNPVTNENAKEICNRLDYDLAEIQSLGDLIHLNNFIQGKNITDRVWHLGLTDRVREGEFFEGDNSTAITFQAFALSQPDNLDNEDCVVLKAEGIGWMKRLVMHDVSCSAERAHALCQFRKDTSCYLNSQQNLRKPRDDLLYFGETAIRRYFLSRTQKTWVDAMEFCSSRNKKLLDILFIGELKHFKNQLMIPMLINWAKKFNAGIWTSGRFPRSVKDGRFNWETTGGTFATDDKSINFTWAAGEPSDSTKRNMEICIELAVSEWANSKPGDDLTVTLKATNCNLPNYFVCYEDAPHLKNCHLPPNVDFGFKSLSETSRYIYLNTSTRMNATDRKKLCNYWGLDVAEISSLGDYKLVSAALNSWNVQPSLMYFGLGLNSVGSESMWFEGDGFTPIKFQVFDEGFPRYYSKQEPQDHVVFSKINSTVWTMKTFAGNKATNILCQFKRDSTCAFQSIFNYLDRKSPKNYLTLLKDDKKDSASTDLIKYYVADGQHTWEEAIRFCWSRKKKLLDLDLRRTSPSQAQHVYKLLASHLKKQKIHPRVARFWTSGKYVIGFNDTYFRWESVNEFVTHKDIENKLGIKLVPPEPSTADNDRCLTLGLKDTELKNEVLEVDLKSHNCYLPYFVVCYEEFKIPSEPVTSTTPEPEVKYKELPPCKDPTDPEKKRMQNALQMMLKEIRPPGFLACDFDIPAGGRK